MGFLALLCIELHNSCATKWMRFSITKKHQKPPELWNQIIGLMEVGYSIMNVRKREIWPGVEAKALAFTIVCFTIESPIWLQAASLTRHSDIWVKTSL